MFARLLPSFANELLKLAFKANHEHIVDQHHKAPSKDWHAFEKNLGKKSFVKAVHKHPESDEKLKKYTQANHEKLKSKNIKTTVPSRTKKGKNYKIKVLSGGRLACDCKDWQYSKSHKGTDCAHVKAAKQGLEKIGAGLNPLERGLGEGIYTFYKLHKAKKHIQEGMEAKRRREQTGQY